MRSPKNKVLVITPHGRYEDIADARVSDKNMEFLDGVIPQV